VQGHWAQPDIEKISQAGVVAGYEDGFKPDRNATRAEASSMISRALHKETKAAPSEKDLLDAAASFQTSLNDLVTAKKFDELTTLYNAKTTGFFNAIELYSIDVLKQMVDEATAAGATVDLKVTGEAKYAVKFANDRYAAVEVTGQKVETTVTKGEESNTESASTDETYLLRKVKGEWVIYGGQNMYANFVKLMSQPADPGTGTENSTGTDNGTGTDAGVAAE